jgi:alkylation response protein AidB-like acyl-CoA dehydrogenase
MLTVYKSELKQFAELAQSFAAKELANNIQDHDRHPFGEFFFPVLDKARNVGFLGIMIPDDAGGSGGSISTLCVILENICKVDAAMGGIIFTNALSQQMLMAAGDCAVANRIFSGQASVRDFLVAFPSYMNPAREENLPQAELSGTDYTISGALDMLVLGGLARRAVIPARIAGFSGFSFFLVDMDQEGMAKKGPVFSLGLHACPCVDIAMHGVKATLLGTEGSGENYFEKIFGAMHAAAAAMNTGIMKGALDAALVYARERRQGGRNIIDWSEVGMILANMLVKTDAAQLCLVQACWNLEQGTLHSDRYCISAALHIHELACDVVTDGIQVLGGYGYMKDYGQEKRYRDAHQVQALLGAAPLKRIAALRKFSAQ